MQAPCGPEEDASEDSKFAGWVAPYFAEADVITHYFSVGGHWRKNLMKTDN